LTPATPRPGYHVENRRADPLRRRLLSENLERQAPIPEPKKENWTQRNVGWKLTILIAILGLASCGAVIGAIGGEEDPATTAQPTRKAAKS
jgi:hypothetical protein